MTFLSARIRQCSTPWLSNWLSTGLRVGPPFGGATCARRPGVTDRSRSTLIAGRAGRFDGKARNDDGDAREKGLTVGRKRLQAVVVRTAKRAPAGKRVRARNGVVADSGVGSEFDGAVTGSG